MTTIQKITVPSQPGDNSDEMTPLTDEQLQSIEQYYAEHAPEVSPYVYSGNWTRVTSTTVKPYKAIAMLEIKWENGETTYGAGCAVADGVVLTAGHCLYNPKTQLKARSIGVYFGRNEGAWYKYTPARAWYYSPGWKDLTEYEPAKDWGAIVVDKSVTKATGTLSYSTVRPALNANNVTLTGYPYVSAGSIYNGERCYTDTGSVTAYYDNNTWFRHNLNCTIGVSGGPIYQTYKDASGDDWVVRGIHTGDWSTETAPGGSGKTIDSKVVNTINAAKNYVPKS